MLRRPYTNAPPRRIAACPLAPQGHTLSAADQYVGSTTVTPMDEHVVALDLGVTWEPNAPAAVLLSDDYGKTVLAMNAHQDDPDRRSVALVWSGSRYACLADPNDEAISGHRLYVHGLSDVLWAGVVRDSDLIRALEKQNRVHPGHDPSRFEPLTHHVVLLKECVVEVVAQALSVQRFEGTTLDTATGAIGD